MLRSSVTILNALLLFAFLGATAPAGFGASQTAKRLHSEIDDTETFALSGNVRPAVAKGLAQDRGEVASSQAMPTMSIHFALTSAQQADLQQLLAAQQDKHSAQYHKFLTPEDYAARFGLNTADVQKITFWLENKGFSNVQVARSRTWVSFEGTAGQAQAAFHTSIHNYSLNGETHLANANAPQLPKALAGIAAGVRGLQSFPIKPRAKLHPHFTSNISGLHFLAPDDWATIYNVQPLYSAGLDGTGVTIAVVGQSDVQLTDLRAFRSAAGLSLKDPTVVVVGTFDPGIQSASGDENESDLDLEWSGAIARNANILFVTANFTRGNGVEDALTYAVDNNVAPILSTSYGLCEAQAQTVDFTTDNNLFAQANSQGMTIIAAAGDAGAADCDPPTANPNETVATQGLAVDFPASSAYVTGIGGTSFNEGSGNYWNTSNNSYGGSAISYIPETVWNDAFLSAGGGGASAYVLKPSWQTGTGVPNDNARDVPDLAAAASASHDELLICGDGSCVNGFRYTDSTLDTTGGTSAGAPTTAGVIALLLQHNGTGSRLGNINPNLYALAAMSPTAFNDVTQGNNYTACQAGSPNCPASLQFGYAAGVGYDQVTGLGSLNAYNLVEDWAFDYQLSASPSTLSIQPGSSATSAVAVTPQSHFSGAVSFTCSVASTLANVTCSVPSAAVNTPGTTTVTITAGSTASAPFVWFFRKMPPFYSGLVWLLVALTFATAVYKFRKQRGAYTWAAVAVCALLVGAISCGGGGSSGSTGGSGGGSTTSSETGLVTVTATSGQLTNTATISVTVP